MIVPYNLEQNGVAKRKNHRIEESVRVMLHDQDLPQFLWGEASKKVVYIQNQSPHRMLENMNPKEVFTRKRPCVYNIWIFGFLVYIHIAKDRRKKLDPISLKGILIGYSNSSEVYRIYIKQGHRIEVSRDVIFHERVAYKKSKDHLIDSYDEELFIFEECQREEEDSNHEEEGPSEPV